MNYAIKEIYFTLQGEGAQTGRPSVFLRVAGCNLWSGREADREQAVCRFCDTDFIGTDGPGGGRFVSAQEVAKAVQSCWAQNASDDPSDDPSDDSSDGACRPYVVCTGGEPLLQLDADLIDAFHHLNFEIGVETNGTLAAPANIDWICVSPKAGAGLVQKTGDELKFVYPQAGLAPKSLEKLDFAHFFLQPMDGPKRRENTNAAIAYCVAHPRWRLSLQTHKLIGIA